MRLTELINGEIKTTASPDEILERLYDLEQREERAAQGFNGHFQHSVNEWHGTNPYEVWQDFINGKLVYKNGARLNQLLRDRSKMLVETPDFHETLPSESGYVPSRENLFKDQRKARQEADMVDRMGDYI